MRFEDAFGPPRAVHPGDQSANSQDAAKTPLQLAIDLYNPLNAKSLLSPLNPANPFGFRDPVAKAFVNVGRFGI